MTHVTTTLWTCARCGSEETVAGIKQPVGWVRAYFGSPPLSGDHAAIGDLCNPCGGYLVSFVNGTEVEDMARAEAVDRALVEIQAEVDADMADRLWRTGERV